MRAADLKWGYQARCFPLCSSSSVWRRTKLDAQPEALEIGIRTDRKQQTQSAWVCVRNAHLFVVLWATPQQSVIADMHVQMTVAESSSPTVSTTKDFL